MKNHNGEITISVIMLTYNHECYIEKAVESILNQKVDCAYEIVVGDDASRDRTREILLDYEKKYPGLFKLILRDKNIGITKNLYDVLSRSSGDYIAILEGDDFWTDNNKLSIQLQFLKEHTQYSGVAHAYKMFDENGYIYSHRTIDGIYTFKDFEKRRIPGQTATMFFRNFMKYSNKNFDIIYTASEVIGDKTLILLQILEGNIYCMTKEMSAYRVCSTDSSWSSKVSKDRSVRSALEELKYLKRLIEYAKEQGVEIKPIRWENQLLYDGIKKYKSNRTKENIQMLTEMREMYDGNIIIKLMDFVYFTIREFTKQIRKRKFTLLKK